MEFPPLTPAPTAPTRSMAPEEFIEAADAFVAWMAVHRDELVEWQDYLAALAASLGVSDADAELAAMAGVTSAANRLFYFTGPGSGAVTDFTAVARTLLAQTTQALMRTVGLGMSADGSALVAAADFAAIRTLLSLYSVGQVDDAIDAGLATVASVPTGSVHAFAMSAAPTGYLKCDGSAVSRATYGPLFAAIGTSFGAGDGSTTFNLPDLRGEFVRGFDDGRGVDAGRVFGSAQADELESHSHGLKVFNRGDSDASGGSVGSGDETLSTGAAYSAGWVEATGGAETRPRNVALLYAIKI